MITKMVSLVFFLTTLLCYSLPAAAAEEDKLLFANEHWPPWIIFEGEKASGIDVDIIKMLAQRLRLGLSIQKCPWARCLELMKKGKTDIISAALRRPEREQYIHFVEPPYWTQSTKLFYLQKGKGSSITTYNDIYDLRIGVLRGSAYFNNFDNDEKVKKIEINRTEQLPGMLLRGRIHAFIGTEIVTDYLLKKEGLQGDFEKSIYRHNEVTPFYLGLSKKSRHAERLSDFNRALRELIDEGKISEIIQTYIGPRE